MYKFSVSNGVNNKAYCILALFFGIVGAHKFYAGKFFQGFIYFICSMFGISVILGIIDCIIGLCKTPDENGRIKV